MDQVFVRYFYEPKYKENLSLLLSQCLLIVFSNVILIALLLNNFGHNLLQWLKIDDPMIIPFLIVGMVLFILLRFTQLISRLKETVLIYNLIGFFTEFFFLLFFVSLLYICTTSYWTIILSQLSSTALVVTALLYYYGKELILPLQQCRTLIKTNTILEFIRYGSPYIFSLSLTWLFVNLDKFFILKWSNYQELGIYTAAFALTAPLVLVQSIFNTAWAPRMNNMLIHTPFKSKKVFFQTFEKLSFLLLCLFLLTVLLKDYLILFVGPEFHQAVKIFPWLLFSPYFGALSEIVVAGIIKSKKSYWHMCISFLAVSVNILGCYFLIPLWGATGAAISVATSFGVFFLSRWFFAYRYYPLKINYLKLLLYISFICVYIIYGETLFLRYFLFLFFISIAIFMEKEWFFNDIRSGLERLFSKSGMDMSTIDIVQKNL